MLPAKPAMIDFRSFEIRISIHVAGGGKEVKHHHVRVSKTHAEKKVDAVAVAFRAVLAPSGHVCWNGAERDAVYRKLRHSK